MKRLLTALLLFLINSCLSIERRVLGQYGPNCNIETRVECYLDELKETTCDNFVPVEIDQCDSSLPLTFVFHYCNWNDDLVIDIFENLTEIRVGNRAYMGVLDVRRLNYQGTPSWALKLCLALSA